MSSSSFMAAQFHSSSSSAPLFQQGGQQPSSSSNVTTTTTTMTTIITTFHLADVQFYRLKLFLNLAVAMAANALGFVLILWASPKHIRLYRWFLLDILLSAFLIDLYFMAILQPLPLLPVAGYCTLGVMKSAGTFFGGFIGVLLLFFLLGFCAASALSAALYRLLSVHNQQHKLTSPLGIASILGLHLLISSPLQFVAAFVIDEVADQAPIRAKVYESYPGVQELLNSNEICVFSPIEDSAKMRLTVYVGICILVMVGLVGGGIIFAGFFSLWRRRARLSERLYRMHWQLSLSLLCQLLVPGVTLYIPFFIVAISLFAKLLLIQDLVQIYALVFSMHSTLNALVMIAFTRPYRQAVLKYVCGLRPVQWAMTKGGGGGLKGKVGPKMPKIGQVSSAVFATEMAEQKRRRRAGNVERVKEVLKNMGT